MKDDAKFFFFISGFIGFVIFFISSNLIYGDLIHGLFHASIGCILFSTSGRLLLGYALSANLVGSDSSTLKSSSSGKVPDIINRDISGEELAASTNVEALKNAKEVSLSKSK